MTTAAASHTEAVIMLVVLGGWTIFFNIMGALYIAYTITNRDRFEIRVKTPSLTILEMLTYQLNTTTVAMREIFAAWGLYFPYIVQEISLIISLVVILVAFPLRCSQLILIFDKTYHSFYRQHFRKAKSAFFGLVTFCFVAIVVITKHCDVRGCRKM